MSYAGRTSVLVRFLPEMLNRIDAWAELTGEEGHPKARHPSILELIDIGLTVGIDPKPQAVADARAELRQRLVDASPEIIAQIEEAILGQNPVV